MTVKDTSYARIETEFRRRRAVIQDFVDKYSDYLEVPYDVEHRHLKDRKYFQRSEKTFTKSFDGFLREYELPSLGDAGLHNSKCEELDVYGTPVLAVDPSIYLKKNPNVSKLAVELLRANVSLRDLVSRHRNFWKDELLRQAEVASPKLDFDHQLLEWFGGDLEEQAISALMLDVDGKSQGPSDLGDALGVLIDCINIFRDKCEHWGDVECLACSISFKPDSITYGWLGAGPHFCAFCVQAAIDCTSDFYYLGLKVDTLLELMEVGLSSQSDEPQIVLKQLRDGNPNDEVEGHLRRLGVSNMDSIQAQIALYQLAVRPRTVVADLAGTNIEEWGFRHTDNPKRGAIALDGHFCQSIGEKAICDYLTRVGISHSMHPKYSDIVKGHDVSIGLFRGDLRIDDSIIEYAGFDSQEYVERLALKANMAKVLGIDLVVVTEPDLRRLDVVFEKFLAAKGESPFLF